jgi:hypothetical protein
VAVGHRFLSLLGCNNISVSAGVGCLVDWRSLDALKHDLILPRIGQVCFVNVDVIISVLQQPYPLSLKRRNTMKPFDFWKRWLLVLGAVMVVFGLLLAFFNQSAIFDALFNSQINPAFWQSTTVPELAWDFQRWAYGVLGATVAGWGVFLAFLAYYPFAKKEKWVWNCIASGLMVWFVSDTAISLAFGVVFNAFFNLALFVAGVLPLLATRREFRKTK